MRIFALASLLICLTVCTGLTRGADEKENPLPKQLAAVKTHLSDAKLTNFNTQETDELIVIAPFAGEKLKKLATDVQKTYASASKILKFDAKQDPIAGKVAVYVFTDPKQHKIFLLQALKKSPRGKELYDIQLRGETPYIIVNAGADEKPTDAAVTAITCRAVGAGLLNVKAGMTADTSLPGWLETGFGNAVMYRAEGNSAKLAAHKSKIKALAAKTRGQALTLGIVWGEGSSPDGELLVTSFTEYLVFGPGAEQFPAILTALKPGEGNDMPTIMTAFQSLEWMPTDVEAEWRKWVLTGK
jgi:hypothetical protein